MPLTESDFRRAAEALACQVAAIRAVTAVESSGDGFLADGHPKVLFERHVFYRRMVAKHGFARAAELVDQHPDLINPRAGGYGKPSTEPDRLARATALDRECALESASWGAFQILGYHWKPLGYPTLQAFINAMYKSESEHLDAFVRFIRADPRLHRALKEGDWREFARLYNGPAFEKNAYDKKLAAAFTQHGGHA